MTWFLTTAVMIEAVAITILWLAVRQLARTVIQLADLAGKTLGVTDALGGLVQQSILAAMWPRKTDDERKSMN